MDNPPSAHRRELTLAAIGDGFIARLAGAYPIVARLASGDRGWTVSLVGASFNAQAQTVAHDLASLDEARQAAAIALEAGLLIHDFH